MEECSGDSELAMISGIEGCAEAGGSSPENDKTDVILITETDFSPTVQVSQPDSACVAKTDRLLLSSVLH